MAISITLEKLFIVPAGAAIIALGNAGALQAAVLTFDDVSNTSSADFINSNYGEFNWNNFGVVNRILHPGSGYDRGTVSGNYTAFNAFADPASLSSLNLFDFNGAYLTAAWNNGLSVVVEGLKNGISLYSKTVVVDTTSPTWFDFNFFGVDQLKFSSYGGTNPGNLGGAGTHFAMDNFTFNEKKSVPEPASTLGLLALGAMGAGSMLKRQRK
ncbi:PEP-CTERM sorting domain-containing protein [Oscillatoria sp. FACHB-1406]|uniref:PEP-CTERM sorting domain-containing protein n=1 Tax=Oscillatoria sp. FACHB-1406 TaxID=2692846 RepID=UPI0016872ACE|nr:PEP-CTERM sorting domain-containing protein [Oscillatoria sp. FACHB-1406]MBD2576446.1 PEP-CTERM sorting domain-containing protein [Oscillatoria sp. FACHB-1406]